MAGRWLVKTEPGTYSFEQLQAEHRTVWDGVRNALALKHLASIRKGDVVLVYHSGAEKAVVGLARAVSDPYPDPKLADPKLLVFDLAAASPLGRPVTLAEVKSRPTFANCPLIRLPRLSVMPVSAREWKEIERLSRSD